LDTTTHTPFTQSQPAAAVDFDDDAEIIQFVSGLEYNPATEQVILAYGINDCEGAITTMDLGMVRSMLKPVAAGKQVVDFMLPLKAVPQRRT
jgi:hypothetical protein